MQRGLCVPGYVENCIILCILQTVHVNSFTVFEELIFLVLFSFSFITSWGISGTVKIRYAIQYQSLNGISSGSSTYWIRGDKTDRYVYVDDGDSKYIVVKKLIKTIKSIYKEEPISELTSIPTLQKQVGCFNHMQGGYLGCRQTGETMAT